jgi:hypothetical protein
VVLVVSEETGSISVAVHGRLNRALTPEALRAVLAEHLGVDKDAVEPADDGSEDKKAADDARPATGASDGDSESDSSVATEPSKQGTKKDGADQAA